MDEIQYSLNTYSQIKQQGFPECSCGLGINKTDHYTLKCKANSWRTMFYNAKKREDNIKQVAAEQVISLNAQISSLQDELDSVKAQLSQYQRMLFGKKSEKSKATGASAHIMKRGKKRGQQKGQPGHGRTTLDLPIKEDIVELTSRAILAEDAACHIHR